MRGQSCAPKAGRISLSGTDRPRVLVTRSLPQGERTAEKLRALGYTPVLAPMLRIDPVTPAHLPDFSAVQAVLVTSVNGAEALARLTPERDCLVLTVGDRTAEACRLGGFTSIQSASGDGKALLDLARSALSPDAGPVVHLRGREAAVTFTELADEGFSITEIIGYEANVTATLPPEALTPAPDAALVYSARTAGALATALAETSLDPAEITFVGISEAALAPLSLPDANCIAAKTPDEAALLRALGEAFGKLEQN